MAAPKAATDLAKSYLANIRREIETGSATEHTYRAALNEHVLSLRSATILIILFSIIVNPASTTDLSRLYPDLNNSSIDIRANVVKSLEYSNNSKVFDLLGPSLPDEYWIVRKQADPDVVVYFEKLHINLENIQADLNKKQNNFNKDANELRREKVIERGVQYLVIIYRDSNGYVLREYFDPHGSLAGKKFISPTNGPIFSTTYNPDGSVRSKETFFPFGLKKLTTIYTLNRNITITVQDGSISKDNTMTLICDRYGDVTGQAISTTPGLSPGFIYNTTTGQFEEDISSTSIINPSEELLLFKKTGRLVYTNITEMVLGDTYEFETRIAINESIINLTKGLAGSQKYGVRDLPVNKYMRVTLNGDDFNVESRSPEVQQIQSELIDGSIIGQWFWNVIPKEAGLHNLTLSAYIVTDKNGHVPIPAVRVPIKVMVAKKSLSEMINSFDWKWLIGLIMLPIFGLICWIIKRWYPQLKN